MPTTLLLASPRIFRPSYGPVIKMTSVMHVSFVGSKLRQKWIRNFPAEILHMTVWPDNVKSNDVLYHFLVWAFRYLAKTWKPELYIISCCYTKVKMAHNISRAATAAKVWSLPRFWVSIGSYKKQLVKKICGRILDLAWLKFAVAALNQNSLFLWKWILTKTGTFLGFLKIDAHGRLWNMTRGIN